MRSKNTPTLTVWIRKHMNRSFPGRRAEEERDTQTHCNVEIYPYFVKNDPENSDYNLDPYKKIFCDNLSKSQTIDRRVQTETKQ